VKILEKLRDPIWQFQGVVGTVLGIIIAIAIALEAPLWVPVSLGALTVVIVALPLLPFPAIKERVRKLVSITKRFCKSLAPKLLLLLLCFVALEIAILYAYADWKIVVLSLAFLLLVILLVRLLTRYYLASKQKNLVEGQPTFSPVPLSGIGTHYFQALYVDPPFGNVKLGEVEFQLQSKSVAFTTNDIRSYIHRNNGTIEVDLHLQIPIRFVKSVHILINSSNSKSIYAYREIGAIELVFTGLPKLTTKLVLALGLTSTLIIA
jgi:hypothetical protein